MIEKVLCQSPRLRIRRFLPADAAVLYAYSKEASTLRELPDEEFASIEEAEAALAAFETNADRLAWPLVFCVARAEDDFPIGHVSLSPLGEGKIEIGYAIGEAYQGQGYGGEAARYFTDWALHTLSLDRLYGIVKESNPASIRCLEKAGYTLLNRREQDCFGGHYAIREYAIDK